MRLAVIESPYAGKGETKRLRDIQTQRNIVYARACIRDSILKGEAPLASHLLCTQPGILDDDRSEERLQGMEASYEWMRAMARAQPLEVTPVVAFYTDLGRSAGMTVAIERCERYGLEMIERTLGATWHDSVDAADYAYSYLLEQSITGACTCLHDASEHLLMAGRTVHDIMTKRLGMCSLPGCCLQFRAGSDAYNAEAQLADAYLSLREALDRRAAQKEV